MSMKTEELIRRLAEVVRPVRPIAPPGVRLALWLSLGLPYVALVVFAMGPRPDLAERVADARWLVEQGAAAVTALLAAYAALAVGVPGRPRWVALLPLPALAVWVGALGLGCVQNWLRLGADGLRITPDFICFPGIVLVGALPGAAIAIMIRRSAPLRPRMVLALGVLAAAAFGDVGLRFFHPQDASLMVLVWQFGWVAALTAVGGFFGRSVIRWRMAGLA